ncbi:unnamed protein product [Soboliphyme baturini]|uniref:Zinc finger protein n=1 Tax=Soboliphyme baturini TaxID=241478 RepID=A0A183I9Y2_9BILA|nr:unnamed protein product [Soboliphyme baturini]
MSHSKRCKGRSTDETLLKFKCDVCGKILSKSSHYHRHLLHHYDVREYCCEHCGQKFVQKAHLKRHVNTQHEIYFAGHICQMCHKAFSTGWQLNRHVRQVHPVLEPESWRCMICDKTDFSSLHDRERHLQQHMGLRPFVCDHCLSAFARRSELKCHLASKHNLGQFFTCIRCNQTFPQRTQVDRHLKKCFAPRSDDQLCPTEENFDCTAAVSCSYRKESDCECSASFTELSSSFQAVGHSKSDQNIFAHKTTSKQWHSFYLVSAEKTFGKENPLLSTKPITRMLTVTNENENQNHHASSIEPCRNIRVAVKISESSRPVSTLELGPLLPARLLDLCPEFKVLQVKVADKVFRAGETILFDLPVENAGIVADEACINQYITINYKA